MKFSFLINSLDGGGTEKVCTTLATELANRGYYIDLFVLGKKSNKHICHPNVNVVYFGKDRTIQSILSLNRVSNLLNTGTILVFNHELSLFLYFIKVLKNKKFLIVTRMNNTFSKTVKLKSFFYKLIYIPLMTIFYKKMDYFIFQSEGIKADLISNFKVTGPNSLIPNPIDISNKRLATEKKGNELLYVGRLVKQKNVIDILYAFKELYKENNSLKLTVVGDGPERRNLEEFTLNNKLTTVVNFVGKVTDVDLYYRRSDVTVLSSFNEGFPNVLLESISNLTPVVSYDCPSGPSEIIVDGINGYLVHHLNILDLKEKIKLALHSEWQPDALLESIARFDTTNVISSYEKTLLRVNKSID